MIYVSLSRVIVVICCAEAARSAFHMLSLESGSAAMDASDSDASPVASNPAPRGPQTLSQLYEWPRETMNCLFGFGDSSDLERLHRTLQLLRGKNYVYSDYSGLSGEYEILWQLVSALNDHCSCCGIDCNVSVIHSRMCDVGELQQQVLRFISEQEKDKSNNETCVMCDILDRLCPTAKNYVKAASPPEELDAPSKAQAYQTMLEWLISSRAWAFSRSSRCIVHQKQCSLVPEDMEGCDAACGSVDSDAEISGPAFKRCRADRDQSAGLRVSFAGTTCKGWSSVGSRKYYADKSELIHNVWVVERMLRAERKEEDCFFSECTTNYPAKAFRVSLCSQFFLALTHFIVSSNLQVLIRFRVGSEKVRFKAGLRVISPEVSA